MAAVIDPYGAQLVSLKTAGDQEIIWQEDPRTWPDHAPILFPLISVRNQPTFELRDVTGSIVGFRFPSYAQGLNVAGYHFHFITDDRSAGGHVLGFRLSSGELSVDQEADLQLELPNGVDLPAPDPSAAKREELDRIERG